MFLCVQHTPNMFRTGIRLVTRLLYSNAVTESTAALMFSAWSEIFSSSDSQPQRQTDRERSGGGGRELDVRFLSRKSDPELFVRIKMFDDRGPLTEAVSNHK